MSRAAYPARTVALRIAITSAAAVGALLPAPAHTQDADALADTSYTTRIAAIAADRLANDLAAIQAHRPSYPFWRHIFAIPDGSVAFGSASDGRLLAVFPARGDWLASARLEEPTLADLLQQYRVTDGPDRRDQITQLLADATGPVVHNPTRGRFLAPNADRYGRFLAEWSAIYERFGVPADIGLAQAVVESGLNGTVKSEARAIGFCQWLDGNWKQLDRLAPHVIEAANQTTQAPYCAAYLTILATKYGSFLPALSEHHAGGTNVGRTIINGARLGGAGVTEQYFLGSRFALALRALPGAPFAELYRTYGPRSYRYTELVFGNLSTVSALRESQLQTPIHAMRTTRAVPIAELTRRTGLSATELRRYNPALLKRVPARATIYLPTRVAALGADVTFWHRPPTPEYAAALADFLALTTPADDWDDPAFERVLRDFQRRFERTRTEEGTVMATVLTYVIDDARSSRRGAILREFRTSERTTQLFDEAAAAIAAPLGTTR